jgi:hypothetical protein
LPDQYSVSPLDGISRHRPSGYRDSLVLRVMGERTVLQQPRISRKPSRLLVAALVALVLVWSMARIRFTDDAPPRVAGQPLLGPLASRAALADLASEVARIETRVQPSLYVANIEMDL